MNGKWRAARILLGLRLHWWLILISVVPSFAPVLRPDPFIPDLAHLEPWRYSVLQLELDAVGHALARLVNERPRAWTDRERREFIRRYASRLEARWQANEGMWLASQLLDPFDYVNYHRYAAERLEEDAWLGRHRTELELVVQFEVMEELARLGFVVPWPGIPARCVPVDGSSHFGHVQPARCDSNHRLCLCPPKHTLGPGRHL